MPKIQRSDLEKAISLRKAKAIVEKFRNDRKTYSDKEVLRKEVINKVLLEEYVPLVSLAEKFCLVRNLKLSKEAFPGPDGEIKFWWRKPLRVQIVSANEGRHRAYGRELLSNGNIIFENQNLYRDRKSGKVVADGRALASPCAIKQSKIERIVNAIKAKEKKYYSGTDTLLVLDDPANFRHLKNLHHEVQETIKSGLGAPYKHIYIRYGNNIKRVKKN